MKKTFLALITVVWAATLQAQSYPEMITVEGGTFEMGDEHGDGESNEQPVHSVTVKTFEIAKTPTTVAQYRTFCSAT